MLDLTILMWRGVMFNNRGIGTKLTIFVAVNLVLLVTITVGFAIIEITQSLRNAYLLKLTAVKTAKADEITSVEKKSKKFIDCSF